LTTEKKGGSEGRVSKRRQGRRGGPETAGRRGGGLLAGGGERDKIKKTSAEHGSGM